MINLHKMKPTLYCDNRSPPVRSVLMLIDLLKIDTIFVHVDLFKNEHMNSDFIKVQPLHTVPALKHNNITLTDSHSILIYLTEQFGVGNNVWPASSQDKIQVINKLFFNGTIFFRRDSDTFGHIIAKKPTDISNHLTKIKECYKFMEKFLEETTFMALDYMTLADISILATLSTVSMLAPVTEEWPRLNKWFTTMKLNGFYQSNIEGLNQLRQIIKDAVHPSIKIYEN